MGGQTFKVYMIVRKMSRIKWFFSVICITQSLFLMAQRPANGGVGKIFGKVKDAQTKRAVEYASISLVNPNSPKLAGGTISNPDGSFELANIADGNYIVKITFLGYALYQSSPIEISTTQNLIDLGNIFLEPTAKSMDKVEIVAEAGMVTNEIDKKVYNTEKMLTLGGGSAEDLLNQIPSVNIDLDGTLTLRGAEGVTVLVDGRPSGITGGSRQAVLEAIPASSIERIEVITNPNAKYDAEGQVGIINIVLKKNKILGLNGSITAGVGTNGKYNAAANLSYRDKKINVYANYSFRRNKNYYTGWSQRSTYQLDSLYQQNYFTDGSRNRMSHMARAGFDVYINPRNTFSLSGGFGHNPGGSWGITEYDFYDSLFIPTENWARFTNETDVRTNYDLNANYEHLFKTKDQKLTIDVSISADKEDETEEFRNAYYFLNSPSNLRYDTYTKAQNFSRNSTFISAIDYFHPFKDKYSLEVGAKFTVRHNDNDFINYRNEPSGYVPDPYLTNRFVYHEQVLAAYAQMAKAYKKWGYKLGLRVEQTFLNTDLVTTQTKNARNYFSYFPSAFISYQPNDKNEIKFGYSKRINRPGFRQLNTFSSYSDPLNLRTGNPNLNPEFTHSFEFSYTYVGDKVNISPTLFYRYTTDVISRFQTIDPNGVAILSFENFNNSHSAGVDLSTRFDITKWFNLMLNGTLYYYSIDGTNFGSTLRNQSLGGMGRGVASFTITKWLSAQGTYGFWWMPASPQGRPLAAHGLDIGMKADIWNKRFSVGLSLSDVFNTRRFAVNSSDIAFVNSFYRKRESRILNLTVTWKFGKQEFNRKNRRGGEGGGEGGDDW